MARLIQKAQKANYFNLVIEKSGDQKALFSVIKSTTGNKQETILPQFDGTLEEMCDKFNNFFADKIATIRTGLKGTVRDFSNVTNLTQNQIYGNI